MGLKHNTFISASIPVRYFGGDPGTQRQFWNRTELRNQTTGEGINSELSGVPYGHLNPSSWNMPFRGGALSSFVYTGTTFSTSVSLAAGRNVSGASSITFTVNDLIITAFGNILGNSSLTFTTSASLASASGISGSTTITFITDNSTLGAISNINGATTFNFVPSATIIATGNMQGNILPYTELSPQNLADAVWQASSTSYTLNGTMGKQLNSTKTNADLIPALV